MNGEPLVSVVIPTYERPSYLRGAVETAVGQTWPNLEVVVVDDGSSEEYAEAMVESFDDRVALVRHGENRGLSAARNTGVEATGGEYVAFLDDDDRWHEEKIGRQVAVLEEEPTVGLVTCCLAAVDPDGRVLRCERSKPDGDLSDRIYLRNLIGTPSRVLVRRDAFDAVGGFDEGLPTKQDWDLYIKLCRDWRVRCLSDVLCLRTVHDSMSSDPDDADRDLMRIRRRYEDEIRAAGLWERTMAEHHRKVAVTALHRGRRTEARGHARDAISRGVTVPRVVVFGLTYLPTTGFRSSIALKRRVESLVNGCDRRVEPGRFPGGG